MTNGFNNINIPAPPAAGSSIVKVDPFYGKDSEDAQEWIEMFLRAKEANGWPDNRRVAIAAGMLREEAADWYNLVSNTITRWTVCGSASCIPAPISAAAATRARAC
jgi:hypothetical protein